MYEAEEIFGLIPEGYFDDAESFVDYVNSNGIEEFWDFMPEGYWDTKEDFVAGLKKKGEKDGASGLEAGLSEQPTQPDVKVNAFTQTGEKDTLLERVVGKNDFTDFFGDLWRATAQGSAQGATLDDALKVFSTGEDISTEDLNEYIAAVKNMDSYGASDEMKDFDRTYKQSGGGWGGFVKGLINNPSVAPQLLASSISAMINPTTALGAGAGAALGAGTGALATSVFGPGALFGASAGAIGGAIGGMSGILEAGLSYTEFLREELEERGLKFDDSGIRKVLGDEDAMNSIINKSLARGVSIAAIDALSGGLATMATKGVAKGVAKGIGKTLATTAGLLTEGIGGSVGEAAARALTGQEMDIAEIGFEGVAGLSTAPLTVTRGLIQAPKYKIGKDNVSRAGLLKTLKTATPKEIAAMDFEIKNDPDLKAVITEKKNDALIEFRVMQAAPYLNEADKKASIKLEKDKQKLIGNDTVFAKKQISEIDAQLDEIREKYNLKERENAISKPGSKKVDVSKSTEDSTKVGEGDKPITKPTDKDTPQKLQEEEVVVEDQKVEEKPEVKEKFETKRIKVTEPFTVGRSRVTFNEDGSIKTVVNVKTGKEVAPGTRSKIEKIILEKVIDVDSGEKAQAVEGLQPEQVAGFIADESTNVREVAQAIQDEQQRYKSLVTEEQKELLDPFGYSNLPITLESWKKYGDINKLTNQIKRNWIVKNALQLDQEVKQLPNYTPETEKEIIQDVIEFAINNPSGGVVLEKGKTPGLIDLELKFEKLTGAKPTSANIDLVVGIEEGRVPVELLKLQEQQKLSQPAIDEKGEVVEGGAFGKKRGPSAEKITATPKKEITVDEAKALKDQIKLEARAAREAKFDQSKRRKALSNAINLMGDIGQISTKKVAQLINSISKVNLNNPLAVEKALRYAEKVIQDAEYKNKLSRAKKLKSKIKNQISPTKNAVAEMVQAAKKFLDIDVELVENIDEYLSRAAVLSESIIPATQKAGKVKVSEQSNIKDTKKYSSEQIRKQDQIALEAEIATFEEITGIDSEDFSIEEMRAIIYDQGETQTATEKAEAKEKSIKEGVKKASGPYAAIVASILRGGTYSVTNTGEKIKLTNQKRSLVRQLLKVDLKKLNAVESLQYLNSLVNFTNNGSVGGMKAFIKQYEGKLQAEKLQAEGIESSQFGNDSKFGQLFGGAARAWSKWLATLPNVFDLMFDSQRVGAKVMKAMGLQEVIDGSSLATKQIQRISEDFVNAFKDRTVNGKSFFATENISERGMVAFMKRTVEGTEQEQQQEFERRKNLIKESYELLISSDDKNLQQEGKIYEEIYNRSIKDSKSVNEIEAKTDKTILEGVDYVTKIWESKYPELSEVSLEVYNKALGNDLNYTPDTYKRISELDETRDITDPVFNPDNRKSVYDKESRVLKPVFQPKTLPKGRVLSFSFDADNMRHLEAALTDINTAPGIQQIKGFRNSESYKKIFPTEQERTLVEDRVNKYVDKKRGVDYISPGNVKFLKTINTLARIGVARTLAGVTQPLKQFVPFINTFFNAGINILPGFAAAHNSQAVEALNKLGIGVSVRGLESQTGVEGLSSKLKKAEEGSAGSFSTNLKKLSEFSIRNSLVRPDVFTAQASFFAYYNKALQKKNKEMPTDWSNYKWDMEAVNYAQQQVDRQQNVSDSDLQGELFSSQNPINQVVRKVIFPFANFLTNQKTRMYADINTLFKNQARVTSEDRGKAFRSLLGLGGETIAFNLLGYGVTQLLVGASFMLMGQDESQSEEEKRKQFQRIGRYGNALSDVFSPIPILNEPSMKVLNGIIDLLNDSEEPFKFFDNDEKTLTEQLGVLGIGAQKIGTLVELIMISNTGVAKKKYMGKVTERKLNKKQREAITANALAYFFYVAGALPAEVGYITDRNLKLVKKAPGKGINQSTLKKLNPKLWRKLYGPGSVNAKIKEKTKKLSKK
jgi:hypothetical protein